MCGISFIHKLPSNTASLSVIEHMVKTIEHRGPDALNHKILNQVALGHARLSIVDVTGGQQPMQSQDGRFDIIYNGEIYNYREIRTRLEKSGAQFVTQSDTEVVLQLYQQQGHECLHELHGMFSFIVYDNQTNSSFIARDRLGIKPLFYHWTGQALIAASEIKSLFASTMVEPEFNNHSIDNYFRYQFDVSPNTLFEGIFELPPGHYMAFNGDQQPQPIQYWDVDFPEEDDYESDDEAYWQDRFEHTLSQAATSHTIGEVPIGAYLSGGIDSAATTYLLKQNANDNVHSFTIKFDNTKFDESIIAKQIADHIGVENHPLLMSDNDANQYIAALEQALYHLEQPQRLAVDIPHFLLSEKVQKENYKVVYTGDGSDEILAGYDCFRQDYVRIWGNMTESQEQRERYYFDEYTQFFSKDYLQLLVNNHELTKQEETIRTFGCYPAWYDFWQILAEPSKPIFSDEFKVSARDNIQMPQLIEKIKPKLENRHLLNQSLYIEMKTRLPGWILWKSDRLSMAHSVEARVPFMDHKLVELAAAMPPQMKLNEMDEKYVLKKMVMPYLPEHPEHYKKRAFYSPIREWIFNKTNLDELNSILSQESITAAGIFNYTEVSKNLQQLIDLPPASSLDEFYKTMKTEWLLMLVLSVQILHRLYIQKQAPCFISNNA